MLGTCLFSCHRLIGIAKQPCLQRILIRKLEYIKRGEHYSTRSLLKLKERGIIKEFFPENKSNEIGELLKQQQTFYGGFDPTADSLHLGNLLVVITLIHLLRDGHRVICLIGDGTASIGDPSGKNSERPVLEQDQIETNSLGISSDLSKVFANHFKYFWKPKFKSNLNDPIILRNGNWYRSKNVIDFISKVGRNLSLSDMLSRSSVRDRLESENGLSLSEFTYQAFQAYDWLYLFDKYDCAFQIGGSDQMGNMVTGYNLIRKASKKPVFGLLTPLLTNEHGDKYGKSTGDAIWLNRTKLSPFYFYQFFIRLPDVEVEKFLKLFTFFTDDEMESIMQKFLKKTGSPRYAQERIAEHLTLLVHGEEGLKLAKETTKALYEEDCESIGRLSRLEMSEVFGEALTCPLFLEPGETTVLDLALKTNCFRSQSDAIKIITGGGFYVNYKKIVNPAQPINDDHILAKSNTSLVRIGKKRYYIMQWN
ncbi:Tyrosine--tRNA ligase, mitochondrial [Halotydeus destructor]|nr:Tyrosine--tRNA ligase, mitochondrial [Halotydeus destructor]